MTDQGTTTVEFVALSGLKPARRNPKGHDHEGIMASITRFGLWYVPVTVNWRSRNAKEADAALLGDNQLTIAGGWSNGLEVLSILNSHTDLAGTGFSAGHIEELKASWSAPLEPNEADTGSTSHLPGDGDLLSVAEYAKTTPTRTVSRGEVWNLDHHTMVCGSLMSDHHLWSEVLNRPSDRPVLFLPYAGLQERMTADIAADITASPGLATGVLVVVSGWHSCMQARGIQRSARMETTATFGHVPPHLAAALLAAHGG